mmetsp:Transcript_34408/g.77745  ORF Transcript_34408/g.77745 Transcript_34408/m.77745 type:complete len:84 (-) Transcript_34408:206-457(-)
MNWPSIVRQVKSGEFPSDAYSPYTMAKGQEEEFLSLLASQAAEKKQWGTGGQESSGAWGASETALTNGKGLVDDDEDVPIKLY